MSLLSTLMAAQTRRYADIKEQIKNLEVELSAIIGNGAAPIDTGTGKRTMSAATRAKMAAAAKAR